MTPISTKQLYTFYNLDRVVFYHLITKLARNPRQSLLVMALWIWLENIGYRSVIPVVADLSDPLIDALFDEADRCLKWLQPHNVPIPNDGGLPLTRIAMQMEISLELFVRRRFTAIAGIKSVLNKTCARIFTDIVQIKLGSTGTRTNANTRASTSTDNTHSSARIGINTKTRTRTSLPCPVTPLVIPSFPHPLFSTRGSARASTSSRANTSTSASAGIGASISLFAPVTPSVVPGFPHPLFGNFTTSPINFEKMDLFDPRIWAITGLHDDVPDDDKTVFLTFSRGYPVTEEEVRHLFTSCYGDCIKVLNMKEQALFATMVLNKVEQLDMILNGKFIAKLHVNGKHVWARKYECRD